MSSFSDFIYTKKKTLSKSFCQKVIKKFEADERKRPGTVDVTGEVDLDARRSTDLMITRFANWKKEDGVFFNSLSPVLKEYLELDIHSCSYDEENYKILNPLNQGGAASDTGYQIQRTAPGEFHKWHSDWAFTKDYGYRVLNYTWYLNTTNKEGYTEFVDGTKIYPEEGKLVLFPATWNYYHQEFSPETETRYVATGWIYLSSLVRQVD